MKRVISFVIFLLFGILVYASEGALVGEFSVSSSLKVHFSQGNLQYQASTKTWRFASEQYARAGVNNNTSVSSTYTGWIDLFSGGSSGYKLQPYSNVGRVNSLSPWFVDGDRTKNIAGTNYDWGIYNKISKGGNTNGEENVITYFDVFHFFEEHNVEDLYFADFKKALELQSQNHDTQLEDVMFDRFLAMTAKKNNQCK